MMKERPKDFDFTDIAPPPPTDAEKDTALMTLETALGDYAPIEGHRGFYLKALKMREQIALLRFQNELTTANDEIGALLLIAQLGTKLIYRMEGENFRPATEDEILASFSAEQAMSAFALYGGLKREGEASGK